MTTKRKSIRRTDEIVWKKHENYNSKLTSILSQVGEFELVQGNKVKSRAYGKAVKALTSLDHAITSGAEATKIDGIGVKISAKIDEILATGKLKKLDLLLQDPDLAACKLFQRISGVGPSTAIKWVKENKFKTLDDLKKVNLTAHQKIGIKYIEEFEQRIPRAEVQQLEAIVFAEIKKIDPNILAETCGSYRRGAKSSGDIDVLLSHPDYKDMANDKHKIIERIVSALTKTKFLTDHISTGKLKYMGVCQLPSDDSPNPNLHRRIDLRIVPLDKYWCGLLYFTGSDYFNTQMRNIALERGYTLNEYDLCPIGETGELGPPLQVTCEEDVFTMLGMEYRTPKERDL